MLNTEGISDLNQISLTGLRAIALIGLLIVKPRSIGEIKAAFVDMNIMDKTQSDDILRIDLNTIKAMGCEINRASKSTNFKYVLTKHPFALPVTLDDYKLLKRVYDKVKDTVSIAVLIKYDMLFKKIASFIYDTEIKEAFLGISALKEFDIEQLSNLEADCNNERTITIFYKKVNSSTASKKEIIAQKLVFNNDKVYLYGYDINKKGSVVLNVKYITSILSRKLTSDGINLKPVKVKFFIKDFGTDSPSDEENVIEVNDNGYIVEGNYFNEFLAIQRILSFGANCKVLEPIDFQDRIISALKEMRKTYE